MYRARLQSVATRLWNEAWIRPVLQRSLPIALRQNSLRSSYALLLATSVLVPLAASAPETTTTHCDDPGKESGSENDVPLPLEAILVAQSDDTETDQDHSGNDAADAPTDNPLWPSGVSVDMVNDYVDEILANPDINIKSVPDSMERIIYVSTVRLTLDTVYQCVSWLHGTEVLGHRIVLDRCAADDAEGLDFRLNTGKKLNYDVLEAMADELLKNKAINQRWLPDIIERQVYVNCMRIMFTIIDGVADTMAFRMCGHQLNLSFEPIDGERARELVRRHSHGIEIDEPALDALIDETMRESYVASPMTEAISYLPGYQSFLRTLHKTLCKFRMILSIWCMLSTVLYRHSHCFIIVLYQQTPSFSGY